MNIAAPSICYEWSAYNWSEMSGQATEEDRAALPVCLGMVKTDHFDAGDLG
jgi:hypothetical protein